MPMLKAPLVGKGFWTFPVTWFSQQYRHWFIQDAILRGATLDILQLLQSVHASHITVIGVSLLNLDTQLRIFGIGWWLLLGSWWPSLGNIPTNWRLYPLKMERFPTSKNESPISLNTKVFWCKRAPPFFLKTSWPEKHPRNTGFPPKGPFFQS